MTENRPPPLGLALAAVAALVFVGGTLWSVLSAKDAEIEGEQPRPTLEAVMDGSELVIRGSAAAVERLGDPSDAGVLATIEVEEVIVPPDGGNDIEEVVIYDTDFRENWRGGDEMLLFLGVEDELPQGAEYRVRERCVLEDGALPCPYDPADIERTAP